MDKEDYKTNMIFPIITEDALKLPVYLTGIGVMENQHPCLRPIGLPIYHFLYVTKGKGYLRIDKTEYVLKENMGCYFEPDTPHEYYAEEEPWTTYWIIFQGFAARSLCVNSGLNRSMVFHVNDISKLNQFHNDIYISVEGTGLTRTVDASIQLYRFLLNLSTCIGSENYKTRQLRNMRLQSVITHIEYNYSSDITIDEMAGIAGVSPQHFCRIFKQEFNMRPFEYLSRCRLQNAKELLLGSDGLLLKEISSKCGFNDVSYFCSVFKQNEGITPIEFKNLHHHPGYL